MGREDVQILAKWLYKGPVVPWGGGDTLGPADMEQLSLDRSSTVKKTNVRHASVTPFSCLFVRPSVRNFVFLSITL